MSGSRAHHTCSSASARAASSWLRVVMKVEMRSARACARKWFASFSAPFRLLDRCIADASSRARSCLHVHVHE